MKQRVSLLFIIFNLTFCVIYGQIFEGDSANLLVKGSTKVVLNQTNMSIQYIVLSEKYFVAEKNNQRWLSEVLLKKDKRSSFELYKIENDLEGFKHFIYKQKINKLQVEHSIFKVHCKNGKVVSANGEYYPYQTIDSIHNLSDSDAINMGLDYFEKQHINRESCNAHYIAAVYFPTKDHQLILTHKLDIDVKGLIRKRAYLYFSASSGDLIFNENRIHTTDVNATATSQYCGIVPIMTDSVAPNLYYLHEDGLRKVHTLDLNTNTNYSSAIEFSNPTTYWNTLSNNDNAAYDAHYGAEKTWDYYQNTFSRNSYDNLGSEIISYVHYDVGFTNAFWDGSVMTYGDGDGINYTPLTSTDVVAHEITHAVTEYSAGLVYANESGALNESFSDIFGITIDYYANPSTANFLMGDQFNTSGTPFRNLSNPNASYDPDTYQGIYWDFAQEVHQNSNVQNYWYYLLCQGGSGVNDIGHAYSVNSISMAHAASIAYRTLTTYLTPNATFADARIYSIQSAIDLFGSCSDEEINVTNAWYAVGIGNQYSNAVSAQFYSSDSFLCGANSTAVFVNNSINANSYLWDFGDGSQSTVQNPTHTYTALGNYTVTLIVNGAAACSNADTLSMPNYIHVINNPIPVLASCSPSTINTCCGYGILNVSFNTINKNSGDATEGYKDFTCESNTTLVAGSTYPLNVTTGSSNGQYLRVYIDYNNDGIFSAAESVYNSALITGLHTAYINTSLYATLNMPLRMRILSSSNSIANACATIVNGQAEDYTVLFISNTVAPLADFVLPNTPVNISTPVYLQDISMNAPSSWTWTINGALPVSSILQNPMVIFTMPGTYSITLVVSNAFGIDSITKSISVNNIVTMCNPNTTQNSSAPTGLIYDSGGLTGNYMNNENCSFLISPPCADSIQLNFTFFDTESGYDSIYIYDGLNSSGILKYSGSGNLLPPLITAYSGQMFILFKSDGSQVYQGFEASWQVFAQATPPPIAAFTLSSLNPALLDTVFFTDASSTNSTTWLWDFGDGTTSTLQNPFHIYNISGSYTVTLMAGSCMAYDTISQVINVQSAPNAIYNSTSFNASLSCNDTVDFSLSIQNTGAGTLNWNIQAASGNGHHLLAWEYGANPICYANTLSAINQYFNGYSLSVTNASNPNSLQTALQGKNILLIPTKYTNTLSLLDSCASVIQNFVQNGGMLIICGDQTTALHCGIFQGTYQGFLNSGNINTINTSTPLSSNIPANFNCNANAYYYNFINANKISVCKYLSDDFVTTLSYGSGKAVYIGYSFYAPDNIFSQLIANAVEWGTTVFGNNLVVNSVNGAISPGAIDTVSMQINSSGLPGGLDTLYMLVNSNDPNHPKDTVWIYLTVSNMPCVNFGYTQATPCSALISFSDSTNNAPSNWFWNFGDGDTSTLQNPTHNYTTPGIYQVKLIAYNSTGYDSTSKIITISSFGPIASSCLPSTTTPVSAYGIANVSLHNIINTSAASSVGYQDFTCSIQDSLISGSQYQLNVNTFNSAENVKAWIDFNNDGVFSSNEEVASVGSGNTIHSCLLNVPSSGVILNTPLRLRVMSDYYLLANACQNPVYGQAEDYTITIVNATSKPIANFIATPLTAWVGQNFLFNDLSNNGPTSWQWILPGALPGNPMGQNANVIYNTPGLYDATLIASNLFGSDTLTYSSYIQIDSLPDASFSYQVNPCTGEVTFIGNLPAPYNNVRWDLGDSTIVSIYAPIVNHLYAAAGTYTITMIAQSPFGNDTVVQNINLLPWPPSIQHNGNLVVGSPIDFSIPSNTSFTNYTWNFGDGTPLSYLSNPTHIFSSGGGYIVTAEAIYDTSCLLILHDTLEIKIPDGTNEFVINEPIIQVTPNPFDEYLSLQFLNIEYAKKMDIRIVNALGQILFTFHEDEIYLTNKKITLSPQLSKGDYFLEVLIDKRKFMRKLTKH